MSNSRKTRQHDPGAFKFDWARLVASMTLPAPIKNVAAHLAEYASGDGRNVRPGLARLACDTGQGRSTVVRALAALEAGGLAVQETHGGNAARLAARYVLTMPGDPAAAQAAACAAWLASSPRERARENAHSSSGGTSETCPLVPPETPLVPPEDPTNQDQPGVIRPLEPDHTWGVGTGGSKSGPGSAPAVRPHGPDTTAHTRPHVGNGQKQKTRDIPQGRRHLTSVPGGAARCQACHDDPAILGGLCAGCYRDNGGTLADLRVLPGWCRVHDASGLAVCAELAGSLAQARTQHRAARTGQGWQATGTGAP